MMETLKKSSGSSSKGILTRKDFLLKLLGGLLIPVVFYWNNSILKKTALAKRESTAKIPAKLPEGVSFHNNIIAVNKENQLKLFSARCTHLGCTINKFQNGEFVCQCHGSHFSLDGRVTNGPAVQPLKVLSYEHDHKTDELIVHTEL